MKKIEIVALKRIKDELLEQLQHEGSVHIVNIRDSLPEVSPFIKPSELNQESEDIGWLGQIKFAIQYLKRFDQSQKGMLASLMDGPIKASRKDIKSLLSDFSIEAAVNRCHEMEKKSQSLDSERQEIEKILECLSGWQALDAPLNDIYDGTKFLDFYPLLIPTEQLDPFMNAVESSFPNTSLFDIQDSGSNKSVLLIAFKSEKTKVEEHINNSGAQIVSLPYASETPAQMSQRLKNRLEEIGKEKIALEEEGSELLAALNKLKILFDHYQNQEGKRDIQKHLAFTEQTVTVSGWVKEKEIDGIKKSLANLTGGMDIEILEPEKDESPPIALTNNSFATPFEFVTKLYGYPNHRELDPTPILAIFFFVFFGMCMTDFGYGLLIAGFSFWGLRNLYLDKGKKTVLRLFLLCGISTAICGALAGSWFGDIFNYLPGCFNFLVSFRDKLAIIDPIKDPLKFLIIALIMGFIQVLTGICIQIYKFIRARDYYAAFLQKMPWVVFLTSLILFIVLKNNSSVPLYIIKIVKWSAIGGALVIALCEGRGERNPLKRIGTGLLALYGTVGFYADTLSYSRLLALGLATAVIANVVNQMAILSRGIPYIGIVFMAAILVAGHLFNLLINMLGAFVHTSRLQFVEFFTKFFEGGGRAFKPFALQNKYTYIEDSDSALT
ncbi:V-type ATP synthase subunit I [bacterium]|nr:V-type ATP synthase subunit I [bacterium]